MNAARAVTFVPGAAGAGSFWTPVVERLRTTWRTQVLDLPGLGSIPARADVASDSDLVKDVAKKIDTPTALVGQSMGAFVAIELALRHPLLKSHRSRSYARCKIPKASLVSFESDDHWVVHRFAAESAAAIESFLVT